MTIRVLRPGQIYIASIHQQQPAVGTSGRQRVLVLAEELFGVFEVAEGAADSGGGVVGAVVDVEGEAAVVEDVLGRGADDLFGVATSAIRRLGDNRDLPDIGRLQLDRRPGGDLIAIAANDEDLSV